MASLILFLARFTQNLVKRQKITTYGREIVHSEPLSVYILEYVFGVESNLHYDA